MTSVSDAFRGPVVIENPILNSPYEEPTRHFRFDDDGITDEIAEGRRPSSYFVPIPAAKKRGGGESADGVNDDQGPTPRVGSVIVTATFLA